MGFRATISQQIWDMKYRLKAPDGEPVDKTVEDTWRRVAKSLATVEKEPARWEEALLRRAARTFSSCRPAASSPAPAPSATVTLFNCFVMGTIPDDMGGIFDQLREAALTMQQGGGIGYDFSTLRPRGAPVKGVGADASGPLSLHGCLGRHVPHDHERRLSPRRHDGDAALRPSGHRGLHRRQARAGPAAHVQPLGAGRPTPSWRRSRRTRPWDLTFGGTIYRTILRRARCGTGSCARPTITPSRA